jgi:hypothetical protein
MSSQPSQPTESNDLPRTGRLKRSHRKLKDGSELIPIKEKITKKVLTDLQLECLTKAKAIRLEKLKNDKGN